MSDTTFQDDKAFTRKDTDQGNTANKEEYAYGFIIEVLTSGLYPDVFHVIREYIQNSFDAIIAWRGRALDPKFGNIQIKVEPPSIFIFDNGTGMSLQKAREYRYVGYSGKPAGEAVGFRGIGKLSGISVAEKLIVTTSPYGVPQRYKLVFDAQSMLETVLLLKEVGQNISLNELIEKHTTIDTEIEELDQHYTLIELHNIRQKSRALMEQNDLIKYLALNAPVNFSSQFDHFSTVDEWLRKHVRDYDTVSITVNGSQVYKYFLPDAKAPQHIFVWDKTNSTASTRYPLPIENNEEEEELPKLLAFCWYCEHKDKGQFSDRLKRGLFYKVKNFTVGNNRLTRDTLWKGTAERSFYFFGEVHICDSEVIPSSERGNFEENSARERLYENGNLQIARTLNQIAGTSSDKRRAMDFIQSAEHLIRSTETEFESGLPRETKFSKEVKLHNVLEDVQKRLSKAPENQKQRGEEVIKQGKDLMQHLRKNERKQGKELGFYDIKEILGISAEAARMYDLIVSVLEDQFSSQSDLYESLIKRIHGVLEDQWRQ